MQYHCQRSCTQTSLGRSSGVLLRSTAFLTAYHAYVITQHAHGGLGTCCRSTSSVRKLMCNFEAPDDDVFTLYDNWEKAVARFPHVSIYRGSDCCF